MRKRFYQALAAAAAAALTAGLALSAFAQPPVQEGQQVFQQKCVGCHTIGQGDRVGPDLKGGHPAAGPLLA
jgi:mono/diheme cytochrome c family protein